MTFPKLNCRLFFFAFRYSIILLALISFLSCVDGTTSGTETGKSINLRGRVVDKDNVGVPGVVAKLSLTGLADTTDSGGRYLIQKNNAAAIKSGTGTLDTLIFTQGGGKVGALDIDRWIDSLPDIKLTQRGFTGQLLPTDLEIGKIEAVVSGTGIASNHPFVSEFFYNRPVNEYSGYIFFPTGGKDMNYSIYINVYDKNGFVIGRSESTLFNGLAGNLTIPPFDPGGARIQAIIRGDTALGIGDTLKLSGLNSMSPPGTKIINYAWKLPGDVDFKIVAGGMLSYVIPTLGDAEFIVVLKIANDAQNQSQDTLRVRIILPIEQQLRHPIKKVAGPTAVLMRLDPQVLVFKNKMWVLGGMVNGSYQNDVWSSGDGVSWTLATKMAPIATLYHAGFADSQWSIATALVFKDTLWLLGGSLQERNVYFSENGSNWTRVSTGTAFTPRYGQVAAVFQNKIILMGGRDSTNKLLANAWYSDNGQDWSLLYDGLTPGDGMESFMFLAESERGIRSLLVFDKRLWRNVIKQYGANHYAVRMFNSLDGVSWDYDNHSPVELGCCGFEFENPLVFKEYLFVGRYGSAYLQSGSTNWHPFSGFTMETPSINNLRMLDYTGRVVFNGQIWWIGGMGGEVWNWGN